MRRSVSTVGGPRSFPSPPPADPANKQANRCTENESVRREISYGAAVEREELEEREAMILPARVSLLVGALLAQRLRVLVLIPATAIVLVVAIGTGVTPADTAWSVVLLTPTPLPILPIAPTA